MEARELTATLLSSTLEAEPFSVTISKDEIIALLEDPKDSSLGDIAFPCFRLAKELKQAPPKIASALASALEDHIQQSTDLDSVKATGPYLNFFLDKSQLAGKLISAIQDGAFLQQRERQADKVMIEYSQPNTHKAFHVGHLRNSILGDSLRRIFEWCGYETIPTNYLGDEGTHVARCLWYMKNHYGGPIPDSNRGEFLGQLYVEATKLLDLSSRTNAPTRGVVAAKVVEVKEHPKNAEWDVVTLETLDGPRTVVSRVKGLITEQLVPYAAPGVKVAGKMLEEVEKQGVLSQGMVCSEQEIGLSDNNEVVPSLPAGVALGSEVVDIYATDDSVESVLADHQRQLDEVSQVLQAIESGSGETWELWKETKEWSMQEFYKNYEWLDCKFDHYFFESECGEPSRKLVEEYHKKGVFEESDGAIGANLRDYDLGFCLLIKRDGTVLYATRDLALAQIKFEKYGIDRSIYVVDVRQSLHFKQVFKCLELMGYEQAAKCYHQPYEMVTSSEGNMSSRKGTVILFSELKERLLSKVHEDYLDKYKDEWPEQEREHAAYAIVLGTIRYSMLNQDNNSIIVFDIDDWTSKTGNTGPYLMYAYARISSILKEAGEPDVANANFSLLTHPTEVEVLLHLKDYHATVIKACDTMSPMLICVYAFQLSKLFSQMYSQCSVLKAESEELSQTRVCLVDSVGKVIQHCLGLLGIPALDRM